MRGRSRRRWAFAGLVLLALTVPAPPAHAQSPPPCSQFGVGSDEWIDCVQELATGGGGIPGDTADDPTRVCEEFTVGSPDWRECVEDAATGGGLMPWIVVIPIGFVVLVMIVVFGRRMLGRTAALERPSSPSPATPPPLASLPAPGMGGSSEPDEALAGIRAIQNTGVEVDAGKVMVLDLALLVSGHPERRVRQAVTVPPKLAPRIAVGVTLPVRVDPSDPAKIDVDWNRF